MSVSITDLHIYPVKSLAPVRLDEAQLTPTGLVGPHQHADRQWMVINSEGRFISQRQLPSLATIQVGLEADGLRLSRGNDEAPQLLSTSELGDTQLARVWKDECRVRLAPAALGEWLTQVSGSAEALSLVTLAEGFQRPQSKPELLGEDTSTLFADAAPLLVVNEASLALLNQRLEEGGLATVGMDRFRANLQVAGLDAFVEQEVLGLVQRDEHYGLRFCYPCARCVMITVDPASGEMDRSTRQPFTTLATLNCMPDNDRLPAFGMNATVSFGGGMLRVGDTLTISENFCGG